MSIVNSIPKLPHEFSANELAGQAQQGDQAAFAELDRRYRPRLLKTLQHRLGGQYADAEDVVQESLTTAWRRIAKFNPQYQFATWLYTITFRVATDFHRKRKRDKELHAYPPQELIDVRQRPADETVASQENSTNLWSVAGQVLTPAQFTALWLRYGEGLAAKEVAEVLGKTTVGVRVVLHRARSRLQPHLSSYRAGGQLTAAVMSDDSRPEE